MDAVTALLTGGGYGIPTGEEKPLTKEQKAEVDEMVRKTEEKIQEGMALYRSDKTLTFNDILSKIGFRRLFMQKLCQACSLIWTRTRSTLLSRWEVLDH